MHGAVAAIAIAVVLCAVPAAASASPLSDKRREADTLKARVSAARSSLRTSLERQGAPRARLAALEGELKADSVELDRLAARQAVLQKRLQARATATYRGGPLGFLEALTRSGSIDGLSTRWESLTRIARHDALTARDVKATRARMERTAQETLRRQAALSVQLRSLDPATARARAELAEAEAAHADALRELAALEAVDRKAEVTRAARSAGDVAAEPAPVPRGPQPRGSGAWSTGVASMYGSGSYGHHTADGTVVRPDSMIVAHKKLPFGTLVEFSYGGHTAVARVADRGPFIAGREFDLGPGIARVLGFEGVHTVRYRIIGR